MEWKPIDTSPLDRDLELAVIDSKGTHLVAFPCRRLNDDGWLDVETNKRVYYIGATHWRDWSRAHYQERAGGKFNQNNVSNS
jgi:hypothetical protein